MDYDDALRYMEGRLRLGEKYGNDRFSALLTRLGSPHQTLRAVHIAGTKGKGSTATMAASILQAAGYSVGLYQSPYVYDLRERVQVNSQPISREEFASLMTRLQPVVEELDQTEFGPTTEFELKTAIGFCYFAERQVDYAVVEVGLGGRLDATNVLQNPISTAITTIGFDHMELLGDTLGKIAAEKAGIVKSGVPCVTGVPIGGEADEVISEICRQRNAPLFHVGLPASAEPLTLTSPRRTLDKVHLRLRGSFQHLNAAVALNVLDAAQSEQLPILSDAAIREGLENAWLPGRLEHVWDRPTVILDGAHNEIAAEALTEALHTEYHADQRRVILVMGMKRNHEPETFLRPLMALQPSVLIATEPSFRPLPATEIAQTAQRYDVPQVELAATAQDAVLRALALAGPEDLICVTGSFYTVGDVPPGFWNELLAKRTYHYAE